MMTINKEIAFILSAAVLFFAGCSVKYTLSGQSIPADARTVSVGFFLNKAPLANPAFSQQFTEELRTKFQRETRLQLVASGGDLEFEGAVTGYSVTPMAIQGNETAANNRLSISIFVSYVNNLDETQNFQTSFSRFADFTSDQSLTSVESQLLPVISEQLIQDVFNRAFINW
jgi:hypothetical protein